MNHYGDISKIKGSEVPPVDCIIGGSPCQDLSVAGKRAGLAGERSGLYMEQIRVIREMRERDKADGKTGDEIRPRYMVWENVPGAFSSNKGKDFAAVLEEAIRIADPQAPDIPIPTNGWPTWGGLRDMAGRWSVAWRVFDAQWWGVPQRRRRIALVADFGGSTAHEILFERKSVSGDSAESRTPWERTADSTQNSTGETECYPINTQIITRNNKLGRNTGFGLGENGAPAYTLQAGHEHGVCVSAAFMGGQGEKAGGIGYQEEVAPTLKSTQSGSNTVPDVVTYKQDGGGYCMTTGCYMQILDNLAPSLMARDFKDPPCVIRSVED